MCRVYIGSTHCQGPNVRCENENVKFNPQLVGANNLGGWNNGGAGVVLSGGMLEGMSLDKCLERYNPRWKYSSFSGSDVVLGCCVTDAQGTRMHVKGFTAGGPGFHECQCQKDIANFIRTKADTKTYARKGTCSLSYEEVQNKPQMQMSYHVGNSSVMRHLAAVEKSRHNKLALEFEQADTFLKHREYWLYPQVVRDQAPDKEVKFAEWFVAKETLKKMTRGQGIPLEPVWRVEDDDDDDDDDDDRSGGGIGGGVGELDPKTKSGLEPAGRLDNQALNNTKAEEEEEEDALQHTGATTPFSILVGMAKKKAASQGSLGLVSAANQQHSASRQTVMTRFSGSTWKNDPGSWRAADSSDPAVSSPVSPAELEVQQGTRDRRMDRRVRETAMSSKLSMRGDREVQGEQKRASTVSDGPAAAKEAPPQDQSAPPAKRPSVSSLVSHSQLRGRGHATEPPAAMRGEEGVRGKSSLGSGHPVASRPSPRERLVREKVAAESKRQLVEALQTRAQADEAHGHSTQSNHPARSVEDSARGQSRTLANRMKIGVEKSVKELPIATFPDLEGELLEA
ncbi:hypothetical protein CYMTET_48062 [Cymbomonas tetramitiformis]|uniref:Uncharacterized protein n=1 Tax=Cymbomonas tetramitiformis TaxID=36881 RepID=A0AAE0BT36_9CHLO|nr:hypothetical protein CYMTET_48062 [Cymbomonas tetramitiformis]